MNAHTHIQRWLRFPILHNTIKIRFISFRFGYSSESPKLCELIKIHSISCEHMDWLYARARAIIHLKCFVCRAFYFIFFFFTLALCFVFDNIHVYIHSSHTYMHTVTIDTLPTNATVWTHTKAYSHCNVHRIQKQLHMYETLYAFSHSLHLMLVKWYEMPI